MKTNKKYIKFIIIFTIIYVIIFAFYFMAKPELEVGEEEITINVFDTFDGTNAKAKYLGFDISKQIEQSGEIDSSTPGEYTIELFVEEGIHSVTKQVKVKVVDQEAPVITLNGDENIMLCNTKYKEPGFVATDNYDKDITDKVEVKEEDSKVIYTVTDSSGNTTTVERSITKCSKEDLPKISLKGAKTIYVPLNEEYTEYGAEAKDRDGNKLDVSISSNVNTKKAGRYIVTYTATDENGFKSSISREVYVFNKDTSQNLNGSENGKGVIYLTFDDGPSAYTMNILNTLDKYNIKATFFVTCSGSDNAIKEEYKRGHTVALHTCTHKWDIYSSTVSYFNDLEKVSNRVLRITGQKSMIMRFPGGASNTVSRKYNKGIMTTLTSEVLKKGYHYFDWNVSTGDAGGCTTKSCVYNNFVKGIKKNRANIVLMHDIKKFTMEALDDMLSYAVSNGYTFAKITMDTNQIHQRVNN